MSKGRCERLYTSAHFWQAPSPFYNFNWNFRPQACARQPFPGTLAYLRNMSNNVSAAQKEVCSPINCLMCNEDWNSGQKDLESTTPHHLNPIKRGLTGVPVEAWKQLFALMQDLETLEWVVVPSEMSRHFGLSAAGGRNWWGCRTPAAPANPLAKTARLADRPLAQVCFLAGQRPKEIR